MSNLWAAQTTVVLDELLKPRHSRLLKVCRLQQAERRDVDGMSLGRWPAKSAKFLLNLLVNAQSNAVANELELEDLVVKQIIVQQAPHTHRRTYRAHGRINPYKVSRSKSASVSC